MIEWLKNNPVITGQLVLLIVGVAAAVGFDVDPNWLITILALLGVPVTVAQRSKVTPTRKAAQ